MNVYNLFVSQYIAVEGVSYVGCFKTLAAAKKAAADHIIQTEKLQAEDDHDNFESLNEKLKWRKFDADDADNHQLRLPSSALQAASEVMDGTFIIHETKLL